MEADVNYFADNNFNREYDTFVNYYIHQINALRFLLSEDYKITYAEKTNTLLCAQSESGIPAIIEMSPYQTTIDWQEKYLVCFEHGYVLIELPAPLAAQQAGKVTILEDCGGVPMTWSPTLPNIHAMKKQAMNFVSVCAGERGPVSNADDAVKDLQCAKEYIKLLEGI